MDPIVDFSLKFLATFVLSGLIFLVMMKTQKQREELAYTKYVLFLKSKGLYIEED